MEYAKNLSFFLPILEFVFLYVMFLYANNFGIRYLYKKEPKEKIFKLHRIILISTIIAFTFIAPLVTEPKNITPEMIQNVKNMSYIPFSLIFFAVFIVLAIFLAISITFESVSLVFIMFWTVLSILGLDVKNLSEKMDSLQEEEHIKKETKTIKWLFDYILTTAGIEMILAISLDIKGVALKEFWYVFLILPVLIYGVYYYGEKSIELFLRKIAYGDNKTVYGIFIMMFLLGIIGNALNIEFLTAVGGLGIIGIFSFMFFGNKIKEKIKQELD